MRQASPELGAFVTAEIRVTLAAVVLLVISIWRFGTLRLEYWWPYLFIGALNCALPFLLFAVAAQHLPAGYLSLLNATTPAFGAVAAALLLGEALGLRRVAGLAIGLFGVGLLVTLGPVVLNESTILGILAALVASASYGIAAVYLTKLVREVPGVTIAACTLSAASFILAPFVWFFPGGSGSALALGSVATLGVLCTAIAYLIYFDLVKRIPPTRAVVVTFLIPAFAALWGWMFLGEIVTSRMLLGGTICLLGTWFSVGRASAKSSASFTYRRDI